jgi:hypothetical protein
MPQKNNAGQSYYGSEGNAQPTKSGSGTARDTRLAFDDSLWKRLPRQSGGPHGDCGLGSNGRGDGLYGDCEEAHDSRDEGHDTSEKTNQVKSLMLTAIAPYVQVFEARVADNAADGDQKK